MLRSRLNLLILLSSALMAAPIDPAYAPLWPYQGTWQVTRSGTAAGKKPDELVNQCAQIGKYFACQQTINGKAGGLLIIIPTGQAGRYYTQTIMPEGRATGRDDLEISGTKWIYSSRRQQGGKTTQYRTINDFVGKDHIHFERAESTDGKQWTVTDSGDERRAGTGSARKAPAHR
jgi:hypothetical protein